MNRHTAFTALVTLCALALAALAESPARAAKAPERKTYFTVIVGLDSAYNWQADCLSFTARELCTLGGTCGTWERSEAPGPETGITFQIPLEESGVEVEIDGRARIDDRGKQSSLGGAARALIGGRAINFALGGRAIRRNKCLNLRRQWDASNPPAQPAQSGGCLSRAGFGPAGSSPYLLPYPVGQVHRVGQTYCAAGDTHESQLAYDLMLPTGTPVLAARAGTVQAIRNDVADDVSDDDAGVHNHVYIQHDDGSAAFYAHLREGSVRVTVGQQVAAGARIASSGASGTDTPLLHFGVYRAYPPTEGDDLPVNFANADGPLDERGGLIEDVFYEAMPPAP